MKGDTLDPKGLIYEAYRIDGISAAECRSIFLDWALSLPIETDTKVTITGLIAQYSNSNASDHPMTAVLTEGLSAMAAPKRRGGWRSRSRD